MVVANCKQCNRIFQRSMSALCPECHQQSLSKVSHVYRFVQDNPEMTLDDISAQCDIPFKDLEKMLLEGKLGTAASKVKYHCQRCNVAMSALQRRGRFCYNCAERVEHAAGLDVVKEEKQDTGAKDEQAASTGKPTVQQPQETGRQYVKEPEKKPYPAVGTNEEPANSSESYGFKRLSG